MYGIQSTARATNKFLRDMCPSYPQLHCHCPDLCQPSSCPPLLHLAFLAERRGSAKAKFPLHTTRHTTAGPFFSLHATRHTTRMKRASNRASEGRPTLRESWSISQKQSASKFDPRSCPLDLLIWNDQCMEFNEPQSTVKQSKAKQSKAADPCRRVRATRVRGALPCDFEYC